ncbi:hypothetical protein [Profundibacter sp.]
MNEIATPPQAYKEVDRDTSISQDLATFMPCRYSPEPMPISEDMVSGFRVLGPALLQFYRAQNTLYQKSVNGEAPEWIAKYLDNGKPQEIVRLGRAKAFRGTLPPIIRPDVLISGGQFVLCELDSVPGGFGLTARLADCYIRNGRSIVGDISIEEGFLKAVHGKNPDQSSSLVIVVSDESRDYLDEMIWLADKLCRQGHSVHVAHPRDLSYTEDRASLMTGTTKISADIIYRFMELFDYQQISKWDLLVYLAKAKRIGLVPPPKPHLEEKLWFALFHHPALVSHWQRHLSSETIDYLRGVIPETWIMDPTPLPPHATIPGMEVDGTPLQCWSELRELSQKQRQLVIKPSGFSPDAWGSRGVVVGHDVNRQDWSNKIDDALATFPTTTSIIQRYAAPDRVELAASSVSGSGIELIAGRARITPYYFVINGEAVLSRILVTHCSLEKKKIHGMSDAVMTVCGV